MNKPYELSQRQSVPVEPDPWTAAINCVAQSADRVAFQKLYAHFAPLIKAFLSKGMAPGMTPILPSRWWSFSSAGWSR